MLRKLHDVFTNEYREEIEYQEFMEKVRQRLELNNNSEDVNDKVKRLIDSNFVSDFKIEVGRYR